MEIGWVFEDDLGPLDMLTHSLKLLAGDDVAGASTDELGERVALLTQARHRLDGLIATSVAEAGRAGVAAKAGTRTIDQYVAARMHVSPEPVRADHRVGVWVSDYPLLEEAMVEGRLSRQHVDHVRRMDNVRVGYALVRDQHLFIEWANELEWRSFTRACAYWLVVNDPDGPEPEDHDARNTLRVTTRPDGRVNVSGDLDPVVGGIIRHQLGIEENVLFNRDREHGSVRTVGQRRAHALANLVERGAGRSDVSAKPLIHVVMSLNVLQHAIAQLAQDPADREFTSMLDPDDIDGRCELIDGTPIHPKYALVLLMQARVRRQVLRAKDVTLGASYETRLFPDWMKYIRLVETRGQCVTTGCDADHTWLQADHRQPHTSHGPTALHNLDPLCAPDNKWKADRTPLRHRDMP